MVLELLFEYGEHESSSVAQILNVVPKYFETLVTHRLIQSYRLMWCRLKQMRLFFKFG